MAKLEFTDNGLVVSVSGARRYLGRIRPLTVEWRHVAAVRPGAEEARRYPGVRWGFASHIPGVLALGSFRTRTSHDFWDVSTADKAIVVELTGHKYDRLIIQVDDPAAAVAALTERIGAEHA